MKKKPEHYVDNVAFLAALKTYRTAVQRSKSSKGKHESPRIPEYVGECFLKIATHLSYKPNFVNYTFRDDMISDGVENCLVYIDNFDPEKSSNPFGYFTQIIYYAFIRRIQREKKHTYIKYKMIEQSVIEGAASMDPVHMQPTHADGMTNGTGRSMLQFDNVKDFINRFEDSTQVRKERRRQSKAEKSSALEEVVEV